MTCQKPAEISEYFQVQCSISWNIRTKYLMLFKVSTALLICHRKNVTVVSFSQAHLQIQPKGCALSWRRKTNLLFHMGILLAADQQIEEDKYFWIQYCNWQKSQKMEKLRLNWTLLRFVFLIDFVIYGFF